MIWDFFFSNICIYCYTFPSEPALATPYRFWYVVSSFSFTPMYFVSFHTFLFDLWLFQNVLFSFQVFWLFSYLSIIAFIFLILFCCDQRTQSALCWGLFYGPGHGLSCYMLHGHLKECEFCCLGVEYSIQIPITSYCWWWYWFFSVSLWIFLSGQLLKRNVEVFIYNHWICVFFSFNSIMFYFTF